MYSRCMLMIQVITWYTKCVLTIFAKLCCYWCSTNTTLKICRTLSWRAVIWREYTVFSIFILRVAFTIIASFSMLWFFPYLQDNLYFFLKQRFKKASYNLRQNHKVTGWLVTIFFFAYYTNSADNKINYDKLQQRFSHQLNSCIWITVKDYYLLHHLYNVLCLNCLTLFKT